MQGTVIKDTRRVTTGALQDVDLSEIVQIVSLGCKTACVSVRAGDRSGRIWFERGRAVHARTAKISGEEAFCRMFAWETGTFRIEHGLTTVKRSIDNNTTFLVLEGLRLRDEVVHYGLCPPSRRLPVGTVKAGRPARRKSSLPLGTVLVVAAAILATLVVSVVFRNLYAESFPTLPAGELCAAVAVATHDSAANEPPPAFLRFHATSNVKRGTLSVLVDGETVYSRELVLQEEGTSGFFKKLKGSGVETFTDRWMLGAGEHRVVARLTRPDEPVRENAIIVALEPGETCGLSLVAGRYADRPIVLQLRDTSATVSE